MAADSLVASNFAKLLYIASGHLQQQSQQHDGASRTGWAFAAVTVVVVAVANRIESQAE